MTEGKIFLLALFATFVLLCTGCIENAALDANSAINAESVDEYNIAIANNAFAFDMYSTIKNQDENLFFSPYSIFTSMAICYDGAEGSTKEQMSDVFYFPLKKPVLEGSSKALMDTINSGNDACDLETTNALWILEEYPVNEQYVSNVRDYYGGTVSSLDFINKPQVSRNVINEWVEEKTNEKIKELIPEGEIGSETRLVITNTIYFNGKWIKQFDPDETRTRSFTFSNGDEKRVGTMYNVDKYNYGEDQKAKILELPYKGNELCMYVVLPKENDISGFENAFTPEYYGTLKQNMSPEGYVNVYIPKFSFETKAELKSPLLKMGVVDAFDQATANFSGIASSESLAISEIYHQAFVDVHEKGTEAAAATGAVIEDEAMAYTWEFRADHPFIFVIEDKRTNCILFMGKVESPEY
ncbi:serpin family protein [Methanolobus sp. ZRKC2]|uniref:serpin family protein n=1 Tax=Methanolobus sp. ZRKC2 TaxID=3125783 RepID=UPI00324700F7